MPKILLLENEIKNRLSSSLLQLDPRNPRSAHHLRHKGVHLHLALDGEVEEIGRSSCADHPQGGQEEEELAVAAGRRGMTCHTVVVETSKHFVLESHDNISVYDPSSIWKHRLQIFTFNGNDKISRV